MSSVAVAKETSLPQRHMTTSLFQGVMLEYTDCRLCRGDSGRLRGSPLLNDYRPTRGGFGGRFVLVDTSDSKCSVDKAAVKKAADPYAHIAEHTPHSCQPCGSVSSGVGPTHLATAHYSWSTNTT